MTLTELSKLYWLRRELSAIERRIAEITPSTPIGDDPTGETASALADLKAEYASIWQESLQEERLLSDYIRYTPDPEVRLILRLRFVQGYTWNQVADEIYKDRADGGGTRSAPQQRIKRYLQKNP